MAGEDNLLKKIATMLRAFDDSAWEAMASRGLLRRAQKDLEKGLPVVIEGGDGQRLRATVGDFNVTIPEAGPSKANCNCPAPGVCQHILIACLFLKQQSADAADEIKGYANAETSKGELLAITAEQLRRWAGAANIRAALKLLSEAGAVIEEGEAVIVRFPSIQASCRYVPGGDLDGMVISSARGAAKKIGAAAVIAFHQKHGVETVREEASDDHFKLIESPRSTGEVVASVRRLLEESVAIGISHLSGSIRERAATLSVSALGVGLPRVALALNEIADEIDLLLKRRARADEARLLLKMSRLYALAEAISSCESPPRELAGWSRTNYLDVQSLDLFGVSAYTWRTHSGYRGLTVLFWNDAAKEWLSWSDARPETRQAGFNPASRYNSVGPWQGAHSPNIISRSRFQLLNARRNYKGRLSSSATSRANVLGPTNIEMLDFGERLVTGWDDLQARSVPMGLGDFNPLDLVLVLQPAAWGRRDFDQVSQKLIWPLMDETGNRIDIEVPFDEANRGVIQSLERLDQTEGCKLVARIEREGLKISVRPLSILGRTEILHLGLDGAQNNTPSSESFSKGEDEEREVEEDESDGFSLAGTSIDFHLSDLEEELILAAQSGATNLDERRLKWMSGKAEELDSCGLTVLARAVARLGAGSTEVRRDILRCRYLCLLHRQAIVKAGQSF